jgi:nitric oxide reductase large subunit
VTLLTYLVPLHLRYVGLVGPTGIAGWAVFGFMSVVASWYGVNFLLGSGLHAYAFGSGGQGYVLGGCLVQLIVVTGLLLYVRTLPAASASLAAQTAPPTPTVPT